MRHSIGHCFLSSSSGDGTAHADGREQGDAGGYAATEISSTSRSMSGYQRLKMTPNSPLSVRHQTEGALRHDLGALLGCPGGSTAFHSTGGAHAVTRI
jgi:hypothetical protein